MDSFNEYRRLSGIEPHTNVFEPGISLMLPVGNPRRAVLWVLTIPAESAKRATHQGEIGPRALFDLGISVLCRSFHTMWQQAKMRVHERSQRLGNILRR